MKKKIYSKFYISVFVFLCGVMNLYSQAPPVTTVGAAVFNAGTYSVPVTVAGFTNVGTISMTLKYNPLQLVYTGVTVNAGLLPGNTVTTPVTDQSGTFRLSYIQSTPVVLAAPVDVLFTLTFTLQPGVRGVTSPLTWSTLQGDCDVTPPPPGSFSPAITVANMATYFIGGSINIPLGQIITGPAAACPGSIGNVYTTDPGMTGYLWTVSAGGTINSGNGTNSISVTWGAGGQETVSVSFTDPVNGPLSASYPVLVSLPVPTITGPAGPNMQESVGPNAAGVVYTTEPGMTGYVWTVSAAGIIASGQGSNSITVNWTNVSSLQSISVTYTDPAGCAAAAPTVVFINYYPFAPAINPAVVPKFVDGLPHFAAGLRVNAKAGGHLVVKAAPTQQVALSTGTVVGNGTIGDPATPNAGKGNYAGYAISTDNGTTFGPTMWPAQTIEAQQHNGLTVEYRNELFNTTYAAFNILADQTLMMNGFQAFLSPNPATEPYAGPIPMVVHLHGGEMPSGSDGGPSAWFMPGGSPYGPTYQVNQSSISTYPNEQEATTLWYHPHDDGLTRINVYTGLAGYYFLRGSDEEQAHLPGWSQDDLVQEVAPAGKVPFPLSATPYLPEVEIAIQDRMFNVNGELYWPVAPPNPDIHPYWTPEFVGDIMTVNGKSWPYLSVAPRKYRFRLLEGCNARFLNLWLVDAANDLTPGPVITVIGGEGGLLATPIVLDANLGQTLLMAPGQRYDVVIDFTGLAGKTFTLKNNAAAPYPTGDPVIPGITDRVMQFVVSGQMVGSVGGGPGTDKSTVANIRPVTPLVQLTDFAGTVLANPTVHRQIILNEVSGPGGPASVQVNNSYFESVLSINPNDPYRAGGPTEFQVEGTTEKVEIINISADAHPIHIHLLQWQLVSRQAINDIGYMSAYANAWATQHPGVAEFPAGLGYPGGAGPPYPYNTVNGDGAIGGNPAVSPFLIGAPIPANPEERGWKDNVIVLPGQVTTFLVRVSPTDRPLNATPQQLLFPFDPSLGPGYVWHCHIVDHEDMSMMRPLMILPSALRFPQVTAQPAAVTACLGDAVSFSVTATSATAITYLWQVSTDAGVTWNPLADNAVYTGSATSTLHIIPALSLSGNLYRCQLTNIDGLTTSNAALLTVNNCQISGTLKYGNAALDPLAGFTVTINGIQAITDVNGAFTISPVPSGNFAVTVSENGKAVGAINSTDAGLANYWFTTPSSIPYVNFMAGDVDNNASIIAADALRIQNYFVLRQAFDRAPWQFHNATGTGTTNPPAFTVTVNGTSVANLNILSLCTGDFNASFNPNAPAKGEPSSSVKLVTGESMKVGAGMTFDLPLIAVNDMEVGAVSLILNLPTDMVSLQDVTIRGSKVPVTFKTEGGQIRIGWNSLNAISTKAESDLVILKFKASAAFTDSKSFEISLEDDPLNEIANGKFRVFEEAVLKSYRVEGSSRAVIEKPAGDLLLTVYPNPVKGLATVNYTLPSDGQVTIQIYNSIGATVSTLVNESKSGGKYSMDTDFSNLPRGIYMAKITLRGGTPEQSHIFRFIVNR